MENIYYEYMPGYPTFLFMITKKWFSNGKHSDSQIFHTGKRLDLQMVAKAAQEVVSNIDKLCVYLKKKVIKLVGFLSIKTFMTPFYG